MDPQASFPKCDWAIPAYLEWLFVRGVGWQFHRNPPLGVVNSLVPFGGPDDATAANM